MKTAAEKCADFVHPSAMPPSRTWLLLEIKYIGSFTPTSSVRVLYSTRGLKATADQPGIADRPSKKTNLSVLSLGAWSDPLAH
jgi:hypothetical protein